MLKKIFALLTALTLLFTCSCQWKQEEKGRYTVPEFTQGEASECIRDGDTLFLSYRGVSQEEYMSFLEKVRQAGFTDMGSGNPSEDRGGWSWTGSMGATAVTVRYHGNETFYYSAFGHNLMIEILNPT